MVILGNLSCCAMAFYLSECIWDQYNGQITKDHHVYVYVMKYICQIPILLTLECVEMGATTNHIYYNPLEMHC
jgi:hypothetical protein